MATALVPLGKFTGNDGVGVLASIKTLDERGGLGRTATNIERPADESAVLVDVEVNVGSSSEGDALLSGLKNKRC